MNTAYRTVSRCAICSVMLVMGLLAVSVPGSATAEDAASGDYRRGDNHDYEHERSKRQDGDDRQARHHHGYPDYRNSEINIIIDGLRIGERPQSTPSRENERRQGGPDICNQATGTTWSTRTLDCSDPQPKERSRGWSTSPD